MQLTPQGAQFPPFVQVFARALATRFRFSRRIRGTALRDIFPQTFFRRAPVRY